MNEKQREARKKSADIGHIRLIKDKYLRTMDGDDDYVFISYKSDDYEKVLDEIVYNTCVKYGLHVYFDTAFDDDSDSWITQYYDNMCDSHCKAFIAFIDDAYYSSYACLLEMMSRKTAAAGGDYKYDSLFFLPINLGSITSVLSSDNTGLGTRTFSNGKMNGHAQEELVHFNEIFSEIATDEMRKSIYKREKDTQLYDEATSESPKYGKVYLTVTQCRRLMEMVVPNKNDNDGGNKDFVEVIHDKLIKAGISTVFDDELTNKMGRTEESQPQNINGVDDIIVVSDTIPEDLLIEGYQYTIFGNEYKAGSREQGKLMFDAFEALVERYPGCEEKLTQKTSVAKAEDIKKANTPDADPTYFRGCKEFEVNGKKYLVGTSYGFKAKIAEIKGMFKICGADLAEFVLNGEPLGSSNAKRQGLEGTASNNDAFEYELFGVTHTANKMVDMINDVFDLLAEKYPEKVEDIAVSDKLTAVARKVDLDQGTATESKMNQFKNHKGKEHSFDGVIYLVNAGYNREICIKQIEKMLMLCGVEPNGFKITKAPEKSSHTGNKTGKKGIDEILHQ